MQRILIVGRGKFAKAFLEYKVAQDLQLVPWQERGNEDFSGVIHVGSGRELPEVVALLIQTPRPLLQASSSPSYSFPSPLPFPLIEAPNLCLPIVKLFYILDTMGHHFAPYEKRLQESHQKEKKDVSATARYFAKALGLEPSQIQSIRDPELQQKKLKVPKKYLEGHAYHTLAITTPGTTITLETKVHGRQSYVQGALEVVKIWQELAPGRYSLTDLLAKGLL